MKGEGCNPDSAEAERWGRGSWSGLPEGHDPAGGIGAMLDSMPAHAEEAGEGRDAAELGHMAVPGEG